MAQTGMRMIRLVLPYATYIHTEKIHRASTYSSIHTKACAYTHNHNHLICIRNAQACDCKPPLLLLHLHL